MSSDAVVVGTTKESTALGLWSLVFGVLAFVGVMMIGQASYEWIPTFDPAGWLRIVTGWSLPIGSLVAIVLGSLAVVRRSGRNLGIAGIGLAIISIGIFIVMIVTTPY